MAILVLSITLLVILVFVDHPFGDLCFVDHPFGDLWRMRYMIVI
ncbi:MAG: hypothetical protein O2912_08625 [Proteobacteria bacterium]|nr:hypothetical protein [Pseudomonadota bacterium]